MESLDLRVAVVDSVVVAVVARNTWTVYRYINWHPLGGFNEPTGGATAEWMSKVGQFHLLVGLLQ